VIQEKKDFSDFIKPYQTVIKVLGSGGAGNNALANLMKSSDRPYQTLAINTDAQNLIQTEADRKILIGKNITAGLGAGGDPQIGERSAEESKEEIIKAIEDTDLLFLTSGMGGGTGTGSLPVIGRIAKERGILTLAIVTMPFSEEGIIRWENAQIGLEKLKNNVDSLIVLRNDKLLEVYPDLPIMDAFKAGDEILQNSLESLATLITQKGLINLDFADLSMIMRDGPETVIGVGESRSDKRGEEAVKRALSHPMIEGDIHNAQNALVHITGGPDMTLRETRAIIKDITQKLDSSARIIWGTSLEQKYAQKLKVTIIATGIPEEAVPTHAAEEVKKNETGNLADVFNGTDVVEDSSDSNDSIFDIKESIVGKEGVFQPLTETPRTSVKNVSQTSQIFYTMFKNDSERDIKRFERAVHFLRKNPENRRSIQEAVQSCQLIHSNAQLFGFDEICELLESIKGLLVQVKKGKRNLSPKILDSVTLAMEMVSDLSENQNDGRGETGYIVDRLKDLAQHE